MQLRRQRPPQRLISLVSLIDVLLIMLVFFMVTSTYLNLDMIPMVQSARDDTSASPAPTTKAVATEPVMIRLGSDGQAFVRGRPIQMATLAVQMQARLADTPDVVVLVLPSAQADTQALVTLMDALTSAGVTRLKVVQLEAKP